MPQNDFSLFHLVRESNVKDGSAPLLIMLHGYGSDEKDLFSFASELPERFFIVSARAPYQLQPYGHAWYNIYFEASDGKWSDDEQAKQSVGLIAEFIDEITEAYPVNKENVTLLGFSQGCILSYAVALTFPEKINQVIGLSGYVNKKILPENLNPNLYKHLKVYSSHGSVDQVIPVEWAWQTQPFLNKLGIENQYSEFPVGHGVAPQNFFEFKNWLEKII